MRALTVNSAATYAAEQQGRQNRPAAAVLGWCFALAAAAALRMLVHEVVVRARFARRCLDSKPRHGRATHRTRNLARDGPPTLFVRPVELARQVLLEPDSIASVGDQLVNPAPNNRVLDQVRKSDDLFDFTLPSTGSTLGE